MRNIVTCAIASLLLISSVAADEVSISDMRAKSIQFLRLTQSTDGSWTKSDMVGVTGLVTASLLRSGLPADDPMVAAGLKTYCLITTTMVASMQKTVCSVTTKPALLCLRW